MTLPSQQFGPSTIMRIIATFILFIFSSYAAAFNFGSPFQSEPEFLPVDQAFSLSVNSDDTGQVWATWQIADGYYLYRHQLSVDSDSASNIRFKSIPKGEIKQDPYFGEVEVYHQQLKLPLEIDNPRPYQASFTLTYQGCAERGLCYPPQSVPMSTEFPKLAVPVQENQIPTAQNIAPSEAEKVSSLISHSSFAQMLVVMFGLGLMLSLTPCVLPMVPIVSAIVIGGKANGRTGLALSSVYVLGMAITYAALGALAGWFGAQLNLQAALQNPIVLLISATVFVILALAMFGAFELRLPAAIQTKVDQLTNRSQASTSRLLGIFIAGVLATLIVSPCVSAPLAGVILYISSTSDPVYGATALFSMGIGMGIPLLLVGTFGGKVLPKNGPWLDDIRKAMGFALLGLAVWLANRWLPESTHLIIWGGLSLSIAAYFLHRVFTQHSHPIRWFIALITIMVGFMEILGGATGGQSPLFPLKHLVLGSPSNNTSKTVPYYKTIGSLAELEQIQQQSTLPVVIDLYADWCISCKVTEEEIFKHPDILPMLRQVTFVKVDITDNSDENQALLKHFNLFGPPAMLYFDYKNQLIDKFSLIGEPSKEEVEIRLQALITNKQDQQS